MTLLNHRPLTTPVPLHARWGLSRLSSHQSSRSQNFREVYLLHEATCYPGDSRCLLQSPTVAFALASK